MGGDKIEHARAAVRELLAQLGAAGSLRAGHLLGRGAPHHSAVPLSTTRTRAAWRATVAEIQADGGTNMSSGLDLGLDLVERGRADGRVPHVILISDGLANQGDASPEGLTRRARRAAQGEFMLSTVGVGTDFNEYLMTALADAGTGNYYYVQDPRDLAGVFAREFDAARTTVASGLAVQIEPGPGVRVVDAAGYPLEATGDGVVFRPGSLFAGQERRIWVTLAVPQNMPSASTTSGASRSPTANRTTAPRCASADVAAHRLRARRGRVLRQRRRAGLGALGGRRRVQQDAGGRRARGARQGAATRRSSGCATFKDETGAMNARLRSAPVAAQLDAVDKLEAPWREPSRAPTRRSGRTSSASRPAPQAVDARRAGAKK